MTIQHRVIENSELHEVKGAATAISGTVLTANGTGGTVFDRIGVAQLKGSLPTGVADLQVVTDGIGGFKISERVYGQFSTTVTTVGTPVFTTVATITPRGMYVNGDGFSVTTTGLYEISFNYAVIQELVGDPATLQFTEYPVLVNSTTSDVVWTGANGILTLTAGTIYRPTKANRITVKGIS